MRAPYARNEAVGPDGPTAFVLEQMLNKSLFCMVVWNVRFLVLRRWGLLQYGWYWPIRRWCHGCSAIDFSAVPNFNDLDQSLVIVYGIDDTIITLSDAIGVLSCQFLATGRPGASRKVFDSMSDSLKICFRNFPQFAFRGFL